MARNSTSSDGSGASTSTCLLRSGVGELEVGGVQEVARQLKRPITRHLAN